LESSPKLRPELASALRAGRPVDAPAGGIAADSLAPKRVGELMFPIAQEYVSQVILVTDESIIEAQKVLWDKLRIAAEPGGAAAFASLDLSPVPARSRRARGVIVCGGNTEAVDFTRYSGAARSNE